jgi:hypothetical protein
MYTVLIIGGGIHGTFLSHALMKEAGLSADELAVLDPFAEPLYYWNRNTHNCGMRFLRSPGSHNLDTDFHALRAFAKTPEGRPYASFREPYMRPALELFQAHTEALFRDYGLNRPRLQGTARSIEIRADRVLVHTDTDTLESARVVLAPGHNEHPFVPDWASGYRTDAGVSHVFTPKFDAERLYAAEEPAVVGSGVSAAQLALSVARTGRRPVTLVTRRPLRVEQFDSNPCYLGPKCMRDFLSVRDYDQRRRIIDRNRNPGTVPPDVANEIQEAIDQGAIRHVVDDVAGLRPSAQSYLGLQLGGLGEEIPSDAVALATGFHCEPPAADLVYGLARQYRLPQGPNGYPIPDAQLRWHDRVFVIGALAELELGPACLNIIGAHNAARRLVPQFRPEPPVAEELQPWTPLARQR